MKTGKNTLAELIRCYQVVFFDYGTGTLQVYTEDGFWGCINKKYAQRVCRENGRVYKRMVSTTVI